MDITVEGKTIKVVFNIVDMGPIKDMILGRLWHKDYNPDIDWKRDSHLRPWSILDPHPTNLIGSVDNESRGSRTARRVHFKDSPQETGKD